MDALERIRGLREDHDKAQVEIGKLLGVGQKTYSDYERGRLRIPLEYVIALAKYYDVDMNYICGVSNELKPFPRR